MQLLRLGVCQSKNFVRRIGGFWSHMPPSVTLTCDELSWRSLGQKEKPGKY